MAAKLSNAQGAGTTKPKEVDTDDVLAYWREQEKRVEDALNPIGGSAAIACGLIAKEPPKPPKSRRHVERDLFDALHWIVTRALKGEIIFGKTKEGWIAVLPSVWRNVLQWLSKEQWRVDFPALITDLGSTAGTSGTHALDSLTELDNRRFPKYKIRELKRNCEDSDFEPGMPDWFPFAVHCYRWVSEWLQWRNDKRLKTTFDFRLCKHCNHILAEAVARGMVKRVSPGSRQGHPRELCHVCSDERWRLLRLNQGIIRAKVNGLLEQLQGLPPREQDRALREWRKAELALWEMSCQANNAIAQQRRITPDSLEPSPHIAVLDEVMARLAKERQKMKKKSIPEGTKR